MPSVTLFSSLCPFSFLGLKINKLCYGSSLCTEPQPRQGPRHVMFCAFLQDILWLWPSFQEMSVAHCCISLLRQAGSSMQFPAEWSEMCIVWIAVSSVLGGALHFSFLVCLSWKSGIRHERAGWWGYVQQSLFCWRVLVLAWKSDFPDWAIPPWDSSLLSTFSSGKFEVAPLPSVYSCIGLHPHWTDCSQKSHPLFQAVLCTAGTVNWGMVSADACLAKLSVFDCIQLSVFWKKKLQ